MRRIRLSWFAAAMAGFAAGLPGAGCLRPDNPLAVPTTAFEVERIRDDTSLSPQEKRNQLVALGLSPTDINALLRDERLGNQFGGTIESAARKIIDGDFRALTPDEIQIFGDEATTVDSSLSITLNDQEAQRILNLFVDQRISTAGDLSTFLDDPANSILIPAEIPDDVLQPLFIEFDPQRVL